MRSLVCFFPGSGADRMDLRACKVLRNDTRGIELFKSTPLTLPSLAPKEWWKRMLMEYFGRGFTFRSAKFTFPKLDSQNCTPLHCTASSPKQVFLLESELSAVDLLYKHLHCIFLQSRKPLKLHLGFFLRNGLHTPTAKKNP